MQTVLQLAGNDESRDKGRMSGSAYDTAWAARVTDHCGKSLFPECIQWLLRNQKSDGSWGSQMVNYHDRLISTLSAVMALKELDGTRYETNIKKGEDYIWENIGNLGLDECKLVGSELLIPSLMQQAESLGLNLPYHVKTYQKEYWAKLSRIEESLWYSPMTTLSFSFEFLGNEVEMDRISHVQLSNGSVANSPAATAFFLKHRKNTKALMYLRYILQLTGDGSMMESYPLEIFEYTWSIYNLMLAGIYLERYKKICNILVNYLRPPGVGWSTELPIPDADDTAILSKILYEMQYHVDFHVLEAYNSRDYYLTYIFETDPSISTNIHVLDFIKSCARFPDRKEMIEKLIKFLTRKMNSAGFWTDKWHTSPYYPTSHAILALCDVEPSLAERAITWILDSQNEHGMWGRNGGTLEETAYAVQALMYYHRHVENIDMGRMSKTMSALNLDSFSLLSANVPDLWICKVLYSPLRVVYSSILSAQFMSRAWNV